MAYQQWMWLFWMLLGAGLTAAICGYWIRRELAGNVIVSRAELRWLVHQAAKAPGVARSLTYGELRNLLDAVDELEQAVSMDTICQAMGAEYPPSMEPEPARRAQG